MLTISLIWHIPHLSDVLLGRPLKDFRGLCPQAKHLRPWDVLLGFYLLLSSSSKPDISNEIKPTAHDTQLFRRRIDARFICLYVSECYCACGITIISIDKLADGFVLVLKLRRLRADGDSEYRLKRQS